MIGMVEEKDFEARMKSGDSEIILWDDDCVWALCLRPIIVCCIGRVAEGMVHCLERNNRLEVGYTASLFDLSGADK